MTKILINKKDNMNMDGRVENIINFLCQNEMK